MKNKPIIGIIGKVQPKYDEDLWHRIDEVDEIRYLIIKNGGIAITLLPTEATIKFNDDDIKDEKELDSEEIDGLYRQIQLCDGFILQGGLYSCKYEIEVAYHVYSASTRRSAYEASRLVKFVKETLEVLEDYRFLKDCDYLSARLYYGVKEDIIPLVVGVKRLGRKRARDREIKRLKKTEKISLS